MLYVKIHHIYTNTPQRSAYDIHTNCLFVPCQLYTKVTDLVLCCITLLDSLMMVSGRPNPVGIFSVIL